MERSRGLVLAAVAAVVLVAGCAVQAPVASDDTRSEASSAASEEPRAEGPGAEPDESTRSAPVDDATAQETRSGAAQAPRARRPGPGRTTVRMPRAVAMLASAPERGSGYDRDLFRHWIDADGDGCDARDEVLLAESLRPRRTRAVGAECRIVGGAWRSAYDGVRTREPSEFDVDHVVPLAEAWASGADRWPQARREAFANDLGDPRSLAAVTASSNRSKSDGDPVDWLPDLARCDYLRDWVAVKLRWGLAVDRAEGRLLARRASACGGRVSVVVLRRAAAVSPPPEAPTTPSGSARSGGPTTDRRYDTCGDANAAGLGDYLRGRDPEYDWYDDRDGDGTVCET